MSLCFQKDKFTDRLTSFGGKAISYNINGCPISSTAGIAAGSAAVGTTIFGTTVGFLGAFAIGGGVAVLIGIAGAVAIYFLGEGADWLYDKLKEGIFE